MTASAGARMVATLAVVAGLFAACQPETVVIQQPPIPEQPDDPNLVGRAIVVGQGNGPLGEFRAWIYETRNGDGCFVLATPGVSASGCGPGAEGTLGFAATEVEGGYYVAGGTTQPATSAVVHTADGGQAGGPVERALIGGAEHRYVVIAVRGAVPETIDLIDASGVVLETVDVSPR